MRITPYFEPVSCTWSYVLADPKSNKAAIIDPVWVFDPVSGTTGTFFVDQMLTDLADNGFEVDYLLETHCHADHLSAAGYLKDKTGAAICIGEGIRKVQSVFSRVFNLPELDTDGRQFDQLLADGDNLYLGDLEIRVMATPGHTEDSVTFVAEDAAFIGDTLFAPERGSARCDFPGGDAGKLYDTIQAIYSLPDHTRLFLCHDYPEEGDAPRSMVTVAESKAANIHVSGDTSRERFVNMRVNRDKTLSLPQLMYPSVQVNILAGRAPDTDTNGCAYLKIPFNCSIEALLKQTPAQQGNQHDH